MATDAETGKVKTVIPQVGEGEEKAEGNKRKKNEKVKLERGMQSDVRAIEEEQNNGGQC